MKYKIKIRYRTGGSFETYDDTDYIEYEWDDVEFAKQSLTRIKNHYIFYKEYGDLWRKPEGIKLPEGVVWDENIRHLCLELITDEGEPYRSSAFWVGHFEILHSAEIIIEDDEFIYEP